MNVSYEHLFLMGYHFFQRKIISLFCLVAQEISESRYLKSVYQRGNILSSSSFSLPVQYYLGLLFNFLCGSADS